MKKYLLILLLLIGAYFAGFWAGRETFYAMWAYYDRYDAAILADIDDRMSERILKMQEELDIVRAVQAEKLN